MLDRLDVKDQKGRWLEAEVIEITPLYLKIHYLGQPDKFDEYLPQDEELLDVKYAELGKYSSANCQEEGTEEEEEEEELE